MIRLCTYERPRFRPNVGHQILEELPIWQRHGLKRKHGLGDETGELQKID